jgi:hypothetical protein
VRRYHMTAETLIKDIINTNQTDYLSAIKVLLKQKNLEDNIFDLLTLLEDYNLPEFNKQTIINRYLIDDTFDISSYEEV